MLKIDAYAVAKHKMILSWPYPEFFIDVIRLEFGKGLIDVFDQTTENSLFLIPH